MKQLSFSEMETVNGGTLMQIVDGACAISGVIAIFGGPVGMGAAAFCAGWGLGHVLFN